MALQNREKARQNNHNGKYGPFEGPGACGQIYWMCNKVQLNSEGDYNSSSCFGSGGSGDGSGGSDPSKRDGCINVVSPGVKGMVNAMCKPASEGGIPGWGGCASSGYNSCMGL